MHYTWKDVASFKMAIQRPEAIYSNRGTAHHTQRRPGYQPDERFCIMSSFEKAMCSFKLATSSREYKCSSASKILVSLPPTKLNRTSRNSPFTCCAGIGVYRRGYLLTAVLTLPILIIDWLIMRLTYTQYWPGATIHNSTDYEILLIRIAWIFHCTVLRLRGVSGLSAGLYV